MSEVDGLTEEVFKEMLIEELEAIKSKDIDKDTKLKVVSKEDIKEEIGRSPDFSDTAMMRMKFNYKSSLRGGGVKVNQPTWNGYNRIGSPVSKKGGGVKVYNRGIIK